ncbi:MAG: XRE family transcriptional regulator [Gammaproteobacteria bacterium]|nr:XRE family transcriptional regulator [Gammaproteobacteria bacterium]
MSLRELEKLTDAETLIIVRRRKEETQKNAAARFGVSLDMYSRWERGLDPRAPRQKIGRLENHEVCFLYRRRSNKTQEEIAEALDCCRWWVNKMEQGNAPCDDLISYWEC